jgi:hypothetical protein
MRVRCCQQDLQIVLGHMFPFGNDTLVFVKHDNYYKISVFVDGIFKVLNDEEATILKGNVFTVKDTQFVIVTNCQGCFVLRQYDASSSCKRENEQQQDEAVSDSNTPPAACAVVATAVTVKVTVDSNGEKPKDVFVLPPPKPPCAENVPAWSRYDEDAVNDEAEQEDPNLDSFEEAADAEAIRKQLKKKLKKQKRQQQHQERQKRLEEENAFREREQHVLMMQEQLLHEIRDEIYQSRVQGQGQGHGHRHSSNGAEQQRHGHRHSSNGAEHHRHGHHHSSKGAKQQRHGHRGRNSHGNG